MHYGIRICVSARNCSARVDPSGARTFAAGLRRVEYRVGTCRIPKEAVGCARYQKRTGNDPVRINIGGLSASRRLRARSGCIERGDRSIRSSQEAV